MLCTTTLLFMLFSEAHHFTILQPQWCIIQSGRIIQDILHPGVDRRVLAVRCVCQMKTAPLQD